MEEVGLPRARGVELAPPGLHLMLERRLAELGEHPVRRAGTVLERGVVGRVGGQRVGGLRGRAEVERPYVDPGEERGGVGRRARGAERSARERARPIPRPAASGRGSATTWLDPPRGKNIRPITTRGTVADRSADQTIVGTLPPSTDHAAPVTFDARSEQRNTITAAISSGRPSGRAEAWHGSRRAPPRGSEPVRAATWSAQSPLPGPQLGRHRPRGHRVHQHAVGPRTSSANTRLSESIGRLGDRVGGVRAARAACPRTSSRSRSALPRPRPSPARARASGASAPSRAGPTAPATPRRVSSSSGRTLARARVVHERPGRARHSAASSRSPASGAVTSSSRSAPLRATASTRRPPARACAPWLRRCPGWRR